MTIVCDIDTVADDCHFHFLFARSRRTHTNDSSLRRRNDRASGKLVSDVLRTKLPYLLKYGFELENAIQMTHDQSRYRRRSTEVAIYACILLLATLSTNDPRTNNSPIKRMV